MLPSFSLISVWFIASGYRLDLLFIIVSVGFVVKAKKHSQCCGKIPNICTLTLRDSEFCVQLILSQQGPLQFCSVNCLDPKNWIALLMHNESQREQEPVQALQTDNNAHAHGNRHTLNICVVVALLSSGQAWCAGARGAGGAGGVQHAACALWAPPAPWRGPPTQSPRLWGESACDGVVQQRNHSQPDARTQRYHPHLPTMVRELNTLYLDQAPLLCSYCYLTSDCIESCMCVVWC